MPCRRGSVYIGTAKRSDTRIQEPMINTYKSAVAEHVLTQDI